MVGMINPTTAIAHGWNYWRLHVWVVAIGSRFLLLECAEIQMELLIKY